MSSADPFVALTEAERLAQDILRRTPTSRRKLRVVRDVEPPLLDVRLREGGYIIDGRGYPRVSDILDTLPRPWLRQWYVKQVAEYAAKTVAWRLLAKAEAIRQLKRAPETVRDRAAERGTRVHNAIAAALSGELDAPELASDDERQCVDRALKYIKAIGFRIEGIETVVWSTGSQYAGTCDIWGRRGGSDNLEILDWKTGSGTFFEHAVQVAAYWFADHAAIGGRMIPWRHIGRGTVVHVTPEGCTEYPVIGHRALVDTFLALREVWTALQSVNRNGLGKPTTYHFTGFEPEEDMPIYVKEPEGSDIPPHPEGQYAMRCIDVVDYGEVEKTFNGRSKKQRRGVLRFYGGEHDEEGRPLWIDAWFTLSLHEKANLRKFLEVWRGKDFTKEELEQFDLEQLLNAHAFIQVQQKVTPNRVYANVASIMKLPKGIAAPPLLDGYVRVQDREPEPEEQYEDEPVGVAAGEDDDLPF